MHFSQRPTLLSGVVGCATMLYLNKVNVMSLHTLESRIRTELEYLDFPPRAWVRPPEGPGEVFDVVIVGGGQSGLAAAFGLLREKVTNIVVLDRAAQGREGVWSNFARMTTLRTHKQASGLDFGMPSLTPQAWYTAQHGEAAWQAVSKIPRDDWHRYLLWYRQVLGLPVRNGAHVMRLRQHDALLEVELADGGRLLARKVILATGLDGSGRWYVPSMAEALPKRFYAHTEEAIDFAALKGKRIGVLGGGASAFDNAATALEQGASSVDLCIRLARLPRVNPNKWLEFPGFLGHYNDLDDATRWRFMRQLASMNQPPPQETLWRCTSHANFQLRTGTPWTGASVAGESVRVGTLGGTLTYDFLIFGTGIVNDLDARTELTGLAPLIARWADRFTPPEGEEDESLAAAPYLGRGFQFLEKVPGAAPWLRNVHGFNFGATTSQGLSAASISGMKYGVRRLIEVVTRDLFVEDAAWHLGELSRYSAQEIATYSPGLDMGDWERDTAEALNLPKTVKMS